MQLRPPPKGLAVAKFSNVFRWGKKEYFKVDVLVRATLSLLRKYLEVDGMTTFFVDEDNQELVLHSAIGLPHCVNRSSPFC